MSFGSVGHPELCCRPCIRFLKGSCSDGANCKFCHEDHGTKEATLDKHQRNIMRNLSSQESAALILNFVKSKLSQMDIPGGQELVSSLEDEASKASTRVHLPGVSSSARHQLLRTLSQMKLHSLLALYTHRASQYSEEDRATVERVFSQVQTIRDQLILREQRLS
eukprot:Skav213451  [mRNA]  locus=scaffold837:539199:540023:- [translate_table: standard]